MAKCETIKVEHEDGFMVINESDFDPKVHKKFGEKPAVKAQKRWAKKARVD